jgi:hypothetical protein
MLMGIVKEDVPEEFLFDGKSGKAVSAADLEETLGRIALGEGIEG